MVSAKDGRDGPERRGAARWVVLPAAPASARAAREFLAATVGAVDEDGRAALIATELVTNAVVHAGSPLRFGVLAGRSWLRLEVRDDHDALPEPQPASPDRTDGRGLALVDALADEWGVVTRPGGGKSVWARVARPS